MDSANLRRFTPKGRISNSLKCGGVQARAGNCKKLSSAVKSPAVGKHLSFRVFGRTHRVFQSTDAKLRPTRRNGMRKELPDDLFLTTRPLWPVEKQSETKSNENMQENLETSAFTPDPPSDPTDRP